MNYIVKGKKYIFALLVLFVLSACSVSSIPTDESITQLATVSISRFDQQPDIERLYGGKAIVFKPEAGFAILGFSPEQAQLTTLTTSPNAAVATPAVSIAGVNAWSGGKNAWGGGLNTWSGGKNAWGGGKNAWGGGYLSLPVLPSQNRAAFVQMRLPQAHALSKNFGHGIKVAVIDTGIDTAHPAFTGSLAPSNEWKDFVDGDSNPMEVSGGNGYGHGTGVAGIILQVAPKATILPIRVLDQNGMGDSDDVIAAIDWAVQKGAKVINLSLGTNEPVAALKTMVSYANQMGVFVIASAGNAGTTSLTYPAADANNAPYSDKLFSVGSVNSSGSRSLFSNYGSNLKFTAPGEQIYSAFPANQSAHMTGTSFAAPMIAGAVTLALADNASSTWKDVQFYMANSTFGVGSTGSLFGTLDVARFLMKFPASPRRQALMLVGDINILSSADVSVKSRLETIGYNVTLGDETATTTSLSGKDILIVSGSADEGSIGTKFRSSAIPVLTWNYDFFDDMAMVSSSSSHYDSAHSQTQISVVNTTHPMAAGRSGSQTVYSSSAYLNWGTPNANATTIATQNGYSSRATIFGYEKDTSMHNSIVAPARRIGFFLDGFSASSTFNHNTWTFLEAAVTWAVTGN